MKDRRGDVVTTRTCKEGAAGAAGVQSEVAGDGWQRRDAAAARPAIDAEAATERRDGRCRVASAGRR